MAQQRDIPHDLFAPDTPRDRGYVLGRLLSQVFHPILLAIATILIMGYYTQESSLAGLKWAALCIVLLVLPPTAFFSMRLRQGVFTDEDISVRQQRNEMYLVSFVWVLISTVLLGLMGAPQPFIAFTIASLAMGLIGGTINLFWKISVHSASIASAATITLLFSRKFGVALWLCALAVGWARVRTGNHTLLQVLAGFSSAAVVVLIVFHLVGVRV